MLSKQEKLQRIIDTKFKEIRDEIYKEFQHHEISMEADRGGQWLIITPPHSSNNISIEWEQRFIETILRNP